MSSGSSSFQDAEEKIVADEDIPALLEEARRADAAERAPKPSAPPAFPEQKANKGFVGRMVDSVYETFYPAAPAAAPTQAASLPPAPSPIGKLIKARFTALGKEKEYDPANERLYYAAIKKRRTKANRVSAYAPINSFPASRRATKTRRF